MSLENAPTLADCLPVPSKSVLSSPALAEKNSKDLTLEQVLADRFQVWTKVNEVIEKLTPLQAYQGDIHALQKLQQLHLLCNILSPMHSALHACCRRTLPDTHTEVDQGDIGIDASNANEAEWQQEQERHLDFVDYDAMDLIELSEQFA
ncbi:hypothetical protein PR002_g17994 [Phytophthora rubi]|uniref:Uncharacterized protein n=1 Tax=Phytophthora rubi TaxID=129364 RepID=A0A6A3KAL4_9STRA|nr:hypothetical protein PR002_g17994 [Phytophthora rubi]